MTLEPTMMLSIHVTYLAQLRRLAGRASEELWLPPGSDVQSLLALLRDRYAQGVTLHALLVFRGDAQVGPSDILRDGDRITLLAPMAGGSLPPDELAQYEWQLSVEGLGAAGQERLRKASVLVSRVGGVGGNLAIQLAMAGVGRIILAHAGNLRPGDLNRQLLMSHAGLGQPRVLQAAERLRALNPHVRVETLAENVSAANVDRLADPVDVVASCAPLFEERLLLNAAAVRKGKPLVDAAMYEMEVQVTTVIPGQTPCLACLYPEPPAQWTRRFPVLGASAGVAGCLGAIEVIKLLTGTGPPLAGRMLLGDLRSMRFEQLRLLRRAECTVCG